jgi:hypothetical protein
LHLSAQLKNATLWPHFKTTDDYTAGGCFPNPDKIWDLAGRPYRQNPDKQVCGAGKVDFRVRTSRMRAISADGPLAGSSIFSEAQKKIIQTQFLHATISATLVRSRTMEN